MNARQEWAPPQSPVVSRRGFLGIAGAAAGAAMLAACGGSATATPITATATTAAAAATQAPAAAASASGGTGATATRPAASAATPVSPTTAAASPASTTGTPAATGQKVNANTASQAELLQAFQAAGIPSAARWVMEVMEYRPYPTNDPTFAKLRTELAKYNPSPDVVDKIIATLSL